MNRNTYNGISNGTVNLSCQTENWENPYWAPGQLARTNTVRCEPILLATYPYVIQNER